MEASPDQGRVRRLVTAMATDPGKVYRQDPGRPDRCEVFRYHREWNWAEAGAIGSACERGLLGCGDCRERLIQMGRLAER